MVRVVLFFFYKQKTAYEMRISDWSSDVCSSDLLQSERGSLRIVVALDATAAGEMLGVHPEGDAEGALVQHDGGHLRGIGQHGLEGQIGRASCRERVCQYV